MKRTWKWFLFTVLELLFVAVIPLVIVCIGYGGWGTEAKRFKIYFGVVLLLIIIFWIVKTVLITPWIEKQKIKAGNLEAQLEAENDKGKIANIESALKRARLTETIFSWILPLAFLLIAFLASRAMEQAIVKFSGILGFIGISEFIGFVFGCLVALCVDSKHK
ncbi:MAG: hypothetical protein E7366_05780 [Clostridiales bacterium]|nr:hypothetical protein [Clostridiales bacterium]